MNSLILAVAAVLSVNTSLHLIPKDLGYLSDADVAGFRAECHVRGLTSFEVHSTDGKVRQIKCFTHEWNEWIVEPS